MIFWNPRRGVVGWPSQSSSVDVRESANKSWEFMISTGRLVRDREEQFVHSYPVISKTWCGKMLIRIENKFSMSLSPSASDSPVNTKSESQKVPLSLWNEQQPWTGRLVMDACSSKSSEWMTTSGLLKWGEQVYTRFQCAGGFVRCAPTIFLYSILCLCCRFRLQSITIHCDRRGV